MVASFNSTYPHPGPLPKRARGLRLISSVEGEEVGEFVLSLQIFTSAAPLSRCIPQRLQVQHLGHLILR
jgi:hypothetical protein